jgi:hypothetical protein
MSNHLAVAHVTAALRRLVVASGALIGMGESDIMFGRPQAPDKGARINIALYHVTHHAALRNADLPFRRGDTLVQRPQAALILHFLISFYGKDDELQPARMMAAVVRDLHAHAVLKAEFIEQARTGVLSDSNLGESNQQIIFTPQSLSLEDMSRLWSVMVQTPYALSIAYEAAVVLLDAIETAPAPLPALRRGDDDRGRSRGSIRRGSASRQPPSGCRGRAACAPPSSAGGCWSKAPVSPATPSGSISITATWLPSNFRSAPARRST